MSCTCTQVCFFHYAQTSKHFERKLIWVNIAIRYLGYLAKFCFPKFSLYGKLQAEDFCNVPKRLWRIDVPHWYSYRSLSFLSQLDENKTQVRMQNGTHVSEHGPGEKRKHFITPTPPTHSHTLAKSVLSPWQRRIEPCDFILLSYS